MNIAIPDAADSASGGKSEEAEKKAFCGSSVIECAIVFTLSFVIFVIQSKTTPKLTLLWDSQGYIFTTQACLRAVQSVDWHELIRFFLEGARNEPLRSALLLQMPGAAELVKSGPVLPGLLLLLSGITGKAISLTNWTFPAYTMICLSSLTNCGIWAWAKAIGGKNCARIAAILAISYSGFICNSARILTEIPATTLSIFAIFSIFACVKQQEKLALAGEEKQQQADISSDSDSRLEESEPRESKPRESKYRDFRFNDAIPLIGLFISGICNGLLMLARPTLLPWPVVMGSCLLVYSLYNRHTKLFEPMKLFAFVLGCIISLFPWAMTKLVLTGSPSIMVERYGSLNLSRGLDLRTDGYDSLPSNWVSHPETFTDSTAQVLKNLGRQFRERPAAFFHLLVRKPARLIDSPWNDFQIKTVGVPFLFQRFEHQFILLAAVLGVVMLLEHGRKQREFLLLLAGLLAGAFLSYHFVSCLFITMSRYFITAMPVAIVAASYFLAQMQMRGKRAIQAFIAVLAAPLLSLLFCYLLLPGYDRLSELSSDFGLAPLSLLAALLQTAALAIGLLLPAFTIFRGARSKLILCTLALLTGFCSFVTVCYQFMCSEAVVRLGVIDHDLMLSSVDIPAGSNCKNWYLVIDANDASEHGNFEQESGILRGISLKLNGRELKADWLPLLAQDCSMREELTHMASIAYSSQKRCKDFRQWRCISLPAESVICPGENKIEFSLKDKEKTHPKIFADFVDPLGKRIHSVSLRDFSWTKGFFAAVPGEMRLDEWPDNSERSFDIFTLCGQASKLKPRVFLLGVNGNSSSDLWARQVNVPDQRIGYAYEKMMASFEIDPIPGASEFNSPGLSLRIRVSGQLRSAVDGGHASVCLIEKFGKGKELRQEYAPLAPESLRAGKNAWESFAFEDIITPQRAKDFEQGNSPGEVLQSLTLSFFQTPWWEALGYGLFKGNGGVELQKLRVEIVGQPTLDLGNNEAHWFELNSQFEQTK